VAGFKCVDQRGATGAAEHARRRIQAFAAVVPPRKLQQRSRLGRRAGRQPADGFTPELGDGLEPVPVELLKKLGRRNKAAPIANNAVYAAERAKSRCSHFDIVVRRIDPLADVGRIERATAVEATTKRTRDNFLPVV